MEFLIKTHFPLRILKALLHCPLPILLLRKSVSSFRICFFSLWKISEPLLSGFVIMCLGEYLHMIQGMGDGLFQSGKLCPLNSYPGNFSCNSSSFISFLRCISFLISLFSGLVFLFYSLTSDLTQ